MEKLWAFKVTNPTNDYQTVRICRRGGGVLVLFPVKPQSVDIPWNASHDAPFLFKDRMDCLVRMPEGVSVELEWDT